MEFRCRLASPNGEIVEGVYLADSEARLRHELEELKDRLGIEDHTDDYAAVQAIQAASSWVNEYCGQTFYRTTETRTFVPHNLDPASGDRRKLGAKVSYIFLPPRKAAHK